MDRIITKITVDLSDARSAHLFQIKQGDKNSRAIEVELRNGIERVLVPPVTEGTTIKAIVARPDGEVGALTGSVSNDGNAVIPLNAWFAETGGYGRMSVVVYGGQSEGLIHRLATFSIGVYIEPIDEDPSAEPSEPEATAFEEMLDQWNDIILDFVSEIEAYKAAAKVLFSSLESTSSISGGDVDDKVFHVTSTTGLTELVPGVALAVYMSSASGGDDTNHRKLQVGNLDAKDIKRLSSSDASDAWDAGFHMFVYNGTYWVQMTRNVATGDIKGVVSLSDETDSISDETGGVASTPVATKAAYDRANEAYGLAQTADSKGNRATELVLALTSFVIESPSDNVPYQDGYALNVSTQDDPPTYEIVESNTKSLIGFIPVFDGAIITVRYDGVNSTHGSNIAYFFDSDKNYLWQTSFDAARLGVDQDIQIDSNGFVMIELQTACWQNGEFEITIPSKLDEKLHQIDANAKSGVEAVLDEIKHSVNLADKTTWTDGYVIDATTGATSSSSSTTNFKASDYIDLAGVDAIKYTRIKIGPSTQQSFGIAFYATDKTFISGSGIKSDYGAGSGNGHYYIDSANIPTGAKYMRATGWIDNFGAGDFRVYNYATYAESYPVFEENVNNILRYNDLIDVIGLDGVLQPGIINQDGKYSTGTNKFTLELENDGYGAIMLTAGENNAVVSFLTSSITSVSSGADAPLCDGEPGQRKVLAGETNTLIVPSDCKYIAFLKQYSTGTYMPVGGFIFASDNPFVEMAFTASSDAADALAAAQSASTAAAAAAAAAADAGIVDSSLSDESTRPVQNKVVKYAIDSVNATIDKISTVDNVTIDTTEETQYSCAIHPTNENWTYTADNRCCIVELPDSLKSITITANSNFNTVYAFLTSDAHIDGTQPLYATGSGRTVVSPGDTVTITALPANATYMYIQIVFKNSSTTFLNTPDLLMFSSVAKTPVIDDTLTTAGEAADAKSVGDRLAIVDQTFYRDESVLFENEVVYPVLIGTSSGNWTTGSSRSSYILSVPYNAKSVTITASSSNTAAFAMLRSASHQNGDEPKYATGGSRQSIAVGSSITLELPSNCIYLWILKSYNNNDYQPASVIWAVENKDQQPPLGLHTVPNNTGVLNVIKRCRQLTDIRWTPAVDLPRFMRVYNGWPLPSGVGNEFYNGVFKAGHEYRGAPYGKTNRKMVEYGYSNSDLGYHISFETFITSAQNPNSKFCKESEYNMSNHESTIYADVCGALVSYAYNFATRQSDSSIASLSTMQSVGKLNDNGVLLNLDRIQLGDCLSLQGYHVAIITDIIRNESGDVIAVEICDASMTGVADREYGDGDIGGVSRRKGWTAEQLHGNWGEYTVLRYENIAEVTYTQSPYVNVGDEPDMFRIDHYPVMPYEGNAFVYHSGYIPNNSVKLIINSSDYSHLRIFKDGTEIAGSPVQLEAGADHYNVTEISEGAYTAYLCNMENGNVTYLAAACNWSID